MEIETSVVSTTATTGRLVESIGSGGPLLEALLGNENPYWIIALGPVVDGQYEWAIVSGRRPVLLFVLARDPDTFWSTYYNDAYAVLCARGFMNDPIRYPLRRYHPETCNYGITASPTEAPTTASPTEAPTTT